MSGVYSAEGRAHVVLRRLAQGTATFERLQEITAAGRITHVHGRFKFLLRQMRRDGLIEGGAVCRLTDWGRDALETLNSGQDVPIGSCRPTVRIFARPSVAA